MFLGLQLSSDNLHKHFTSPKLVLGLKYKGNAGVKEFLYYCILLVFHSYFKNVCGWWKQEFFTCGYHWCWWLGEGCQKIGMQTKQ